MLKERISELLTQDVEFKAVRKLLGEGKRIFIAEYISKSGEKRLNIFTLPELIENLERAQAPGTRFFKQDGNRYIVEAQEITLEDL